MYAHQTRYNASGEQKKIKDRKRKHPKVSSNEELAALMLEANTANTAIQAIQQICRTDDGENLLNTTKMTYRRQLRAAHLELLEKNNNINKGI